MHGGPPPYERQQAGDGSASPPAPAARKSVLSRTAAWITDVKVIVGTMVVLVMALITAVSSAVHYFAKTKDLECLAYQTEIKDNLNTTIQQEHVQTDASKMVIDLLEQASARLDLAMRRNAQPDAISDARKELAEAKADEARTGAELETTRARRLALEQKVRQLKSCFDTGAES